jgi:hypothetical protein
MYNLLFLMLFYVFLNYFRGDAGFPGDEGPKGFVGPKGDQGKQAFHVDN